MSDLLDTMFAAERAEFDSAPVSMPKIQDALASPCGCGSAPVAMVYEWRPAGGSVFVAMCRDCKRSADEVPNG